MELILSVAGHVLEVAAVVLSAGLVWALNEGRKEFGSLKAYFDATDG